VNGGFPLFPLNTDGFDPAGKNVLIENVNITNFDDAVAVKPRS
jgi:polygalacturonase